ncbi:MAG: DUF4954 family protein [Bacteroidales bacterium]
MNKRILRETEIEQLKHQGCSCPDWSRIRVPEGEFGIERLINVLFSGDVVLGSFNTLIPQIGGIEQHSGIFNARIHNCTIGNDVLIQNIAQGIANYDIDSDVQIVNTRTVVVDGISSFGNGCGVSVLNETGGREVRIFEGLSSHLAYILVLYRHRPKAIAQLNRMIDERVVELTSNRGYIACGAVIIDCGEIVNVRIGAWARVIGATSISEATIVSEKSAPSIIGQGVIAHHFILCDSSSITDGAIVEKCYIGQGCQIGKQYSAENSLFFANCMGMHGEACSIFAGPYTVTHHKSTLLIAGYFSFLNAGSGSNQSNHMYKLGPIHQGVVERGSKTSSDSYILWPAKIGAFSVVMGRHYQHSDTSEMPFSYLIEKESKSYLVPAANLRSVGTVRDAKKWPKRDKRKGSVKLDMINFNLLSPYTIQKMVRGEEILKQLLETSGCGNDYYSFQNTSIKASSLRKGLKLYSMGIIKFLGNSILSRLGDETFFSDDQMRSVLRPDSEVGCGDWVDIAGLIAPKSIVDNLLDRIEAEDLSLDAIHTEFSSIHSNYYCYEWSWASQEIAKRVDKSMDQITAADVISLIECWRDSVVGLDKELYADAKKEFTLVQRTGFGIDGDEEDSRLDFESVRGEFEKNDFVTDVLEHIEAKSKLGELAINRLRPLTR